MKKILFFLIPLTIVFTSCMTTYKTIQFSEPYVKVYDNLNGNKTQLFIKANEWMVKMFKDASSVIQFTDKEEGTIIGKYLLHGELRNSGMYNITTDTRVYAKIDIRVKDNKARISIEPIGTWQYDPSGFTIYNYSQEDAQKDMDALVEDLVNFLKSDNVNF